MTAEQLSLLDLSPSPAPRRLLSRASAPEGSAHAVSAEGVAIELRFPETLVFLREVESEAVAVLLVLAAGAELADGRLVVRASTRGLAGRLGFLSKDTVHRRLRQLRRAGVLEVLPSTGPAEASAYALHLHGTGLTVVGHG